MAKATRRLLMEPSLFETVTPELARIVTGDPHANERVAALLRQTSMMHLEKLGHCTFWPIFRRFLQWELGQKYTMVMLPERAEAAGAKAPCFPPSIIKKNSPAVPRGACRAFCY